MEDKWYIIIPVGAMLGVILFYLIFSNQTTPYINLNGTFVFNGIEEYYYLQYIDYNKNQLTQFYDLQQVIGGNFCKEKYGNYITDITPQSFRLQCCQNFTSCKNYVIVNKNIEEVRLR